MSYLLADAYEVDLRMALYKIGTRVDVKTQMLERGGPSTADDAHRLIDEVSVLIAPIADDMHWLNFRIVES